MTYEKPVISDFGDISKHTYEGHEIQFVGASARSSIQF